MGCAKSVGLAKISRVVDRKAEALEHGGGHESADRVVIHHEAAGRELAARVARRGRAGSGSGRNERQANLDRGADFRISYRDLSAEREGHPLGNRQSEPRTLAPGDTRPEFGNPVRQHVTDFLRHAGAMIVDAEDEFVCIDVQADRDTPAVIVSERIPDQVSKDLLGHRPIELDVPCCSRGQFEVQRDALLAGEDLLGSGEISECISDGDRFRPGLGGLMLEPREAEYVLQGRIEAAGRDADELDEPLGFVRLAPSRSAAAPSTL